MRGAARDAIEAFIAHGQSARWEDLDGRAQTAVRIFLLDTLGVGIAGAAAPLATNVRAAASRWSGTGRAHFFGPGGHSAPPATAAFINGFQIHCQEFDCVHEAAVVHPLATILAALMAEAESGAPVSGRAFGAALAVAVDLAAGIGVAVKSPIRFFRPANAGIFGATLGVARLRGFGAERTRDALAYALSFNSGTMQAHVEGKPALPVQIGNAARGAIMACDMAEAGLEGPANILEGPYGYFPLFETEWDLEPVIASLGKTWRIGEVSHKPFPTGRAAQGGIVLMRKLLDKGVSAREIAHIRLTAPPLIHRLVGRPIQPGMTANYARLCFQYCGAVALKTGRVGLEDFTEASLADTDTAALGARIEVIDDGTTNPAAFVPQTAVATLHDGREVTAQSDSLLGSPADPLTPAQNIEKFRACVAFGFGFGEARGDLEDNLIETTEKLKSLQDVAILARLAAGQET